MLGPGGRRSPQTIRRDRRRIAIAVVVVVVVAIVLGELIDDLVKSGPSTAARTRSTWISAVSGFITDANALSPELAKVREHATDPADFNRVSLEIAIAGLTRAASDELRFYQQLRLQAPTASDGALVDEVFSWRASALARLQAGVAGAIAVRPSSSAASDLTSAGSELASADAAYASVVHKLRHEGTLTPSLWLSRPALWSDRALSGWSGALSVAANLRADPAMTIVALSIEPPPLRISGLPSSTSLPSSTTTSTSTTTLPLSSTSSTVSTTTTSSTSTTTTLPAPTTSSQIPPNGSTSVIAATRSVRVALVLRDTGNTSVAGGRVTALLLPTSPGVSQRASTLAKVPTLSAGQSIYLLLGKLKVSRANSYDLLVTVTFPGGHAVRRSVRLSVAS